MTKNRTKARRRSRRAAPRRHRRHARSVSVAKTVASLYGGAVLLTPFANGQTGSAISSGNLSGLPGAFQQDAKQALTTSNIATALTPLAVIGLASIGARALGVPNPRFGKFRLL